MSSRLNFRLSLFLSVSLSWLVAGQGQEMTGSVVGDPHFTGFNGMKYDFQGSPQTAYCILSFRDTYANALLGQDFVETQTTVMRIIGIQHNSDAIQATVTVGPDGRGSFSVSANGANVDFGSSRGLPGGTNVVLSSRIPGQGTRLEVSTGNFNFHIENPAVDGNVWYDRMDMSADTSGVGASEMHGILGQTGNWAPGQNTIEGSDNDYRVSGVFATDFRFNRFNGAVASYQVQIPVPTQTPTPPQTPAPTDPPQTSAPTQIPSQTPTQTSVDTPQPTQPQLSTGSSIFTTPSIQQNPVMSQSLPIDLVVSCPDIPPSGGDYVCLRQKARGDCNAAYMAGKCNMTCNRCPIGSPLVFPSTLTCEDIAPDSIFTCATQKAIGGCSMASLVNFNFCAKSCGRCPNVAVTAADSSSVTGNSASLMAPAPAPVGFWMVLAPAPSPSKKIIQTPRVIKRPSPVTAQPSSTANHVVPDAKATQG